jgi:hypothetical protein
MVSGGAFLVRTIAAAVLVWAAFVHQAQGATPLDGDVTISGTVIGKGAVCVQFRMTDGETISLQGASPQDYKQGEEFQLTGAWLRVSNCMQGRAFRISRGVKL